MKTSWMVIRSLIPSTVQRQTHTVVHLGHRRSHQVCPTQFPLHDYPSQRKTMSFTGKTTSVSSIRSGPGKTVGSAHQVVLMIEMIEALLLCRQALQCSLCVCYKQTLDQNHMLSTDMIKYPVFYLLPVEDRTMGQH